MLALLAGLAGQAVAASQPIVTILDGEATLVRGAQRFVLAEGMRLRSDDILHTAAGARLVRLELGDGAVLDLGPDTRLMLAPRGQRTAYLSQGWAKLASAKGGDGAIGTPRLALSSLEGTAVLRVAADHTVAYLERGLVQWQDRRDVAANTTTGLREGHAAVLRGTEAAVVAPRPPADWLKDLPRSFADSLPQRAALFQAKSVEPSSPGRPGYAELAPWLHAEPAVRQGLVQRFLPLAQDKPFRAALVADMRLHPEWDRVLFPEKYRPKPPPVARAPKPAASAPAAADPAGVAVAPPAAPLTLSEKP